MSSSSSPTEPQPTAWRLFLIFSRIGLTSFGGGLSGWLFREFVQDRHWISEEDFLNGLSLSQALPGVNVKNMAIWIGYRLVGTSGAIAGILGIIVPPAIFIVLLGILFTSLERYPISSIALAGAAAAAIGLSACMAIVAAVRVPRRVIPLLVMASTFVMVALLQWPLVWVVLGEALFSVAVEYRRLKAESGK